MDVKTYFHVWNVKWILEILSRAQEIGTCLLKFMLSCVKYMLDILSRAQQIGSCLASSPSYAQVAYSFHLMKNCILCYMLWQINYLTMIIGYGRPPCCLTEKISPLSGVSHISCSYMMMWIGFVFIHLYFVRSRCASAFVVVVGIPQWISSLLSSPCVFQFDGQWGFWCFLFLPGDLSLVYCLLHCNSVMMWRLHRTR